MDGSARQEAGLAQNGSFTEEEIAAWHKERREAATGHSTDPSEGSGTDQAELMDICFHCKNPFYIHDSEAGAFGLCGFCADRD